MLDEQQACATLAWEAVIRRKNILKRITDVAFTLLNNASRRCNIKMKSQSAKKIKYWSVY